MTSADEIVELEQTLLKLENLHASFDYLRISIASPKRIKSWAQRILPGGRILGEVTREETINYKTFQPETDGLFCETIFGPINNWRCKCGKYNGFLVNKVCELCDVEVIEARVRRYRMGYIELCIPVTHLWYLKGVPNYLFLLLKCYGADLKSAYIEQIVYFKDLDEESFPDALYPFLYRNMDENELQQFFLEECEYSDSKGKELFPPKEVLKKRMGSEIIKAALEALDISDEIQQARSFISNRSIQTLNKSFIPEKTLIRRIRVLESFLSTKVSPSWMILTTLPVLPPTLRPIVELENGRLVAADINEIYKLIIIRNNRLKYFIYHYMAPDLITIDARKLLQETVDSLIDNARLPKEKIILLNNKPLKSLTEILEGKQGRFRQSLLGKRVDYSGRSVIVVGPQLRLNQCGLPYEMAIELFQPFLINELLKTKIKVPSHNTKLAHVIIKKNKPFIWTLLEGLTSKKSILLNRAPTLHRFGIQAFDPIIILGQAIHLHPLVCTGFNADFDGDQMAVHLPLYEVSQLEARTLMRPSFNVLSPSNGEVILKPTQDMVIGCYYLTLMIKKQTSPIKKWFSNEKEVLVSFYQKKLTLHTPVLVRYKVSNLQVRVKNEKLIFLDNSNPLENNSKEISIYKIFKLLEKKLEKYYILTNIGIFIAYKDYYFSVTDFFLETTPGRLIFSINFKNAINK